MRLRYAPRAPVPGALPAMPRSFCPRRSLWPAAACLLACTALPALAQPIAWSGRVGLASAWLVRGLQLGDDGTPVGFAGADAYWSGWSLGVAGGRLRERDGPWTSVWTVRAGREQALDERWRLLLDLQYTGYARASTLYGWRGTQLALGLADGDRWSITWNADQLRDPPLVARSLDLNARWPLPAGWALTGGFGRVLHTPLERYNYGQAGLAWQAGDWRLQLDRTWTQAGVARSYGALGGGRPWVASVQWIF